MSDIGSLPAVFGDIVQQHHESGHRREIAFHLVGYHRLVVGHSLPGMGLGNHSLGCRDLESHSLGFHGPGFRIPGCRGLGYHILGTARSPGTVRSSETAHKPEIAHSSEEDLGCRSLSLHSPGCHDLETVHNPGTAHSLEKDLDCHIPDFRSLGCHGLEIDHNLDFRTGFVLETDYSRNLVHGTADSVRCEIVIESHAYRHRPSCSKRSRRARRPS